MNLNNKGLTIVELIVTISLISVVMLFMYRLLADVTFEKDNEFFASLNQRQRVEIIDTIETAIRGNNNITKILASGNKIDFSNSGSTILYSIVIENSGKQLTFYQGTNTVLNRWTMQTGTLSLTPTCENIDKLYTCSISMFTTNIDNKISNGINNNNTIDDLILTFIIN